jgi:hypothetical protein
MIIHTFKLTINRADFDDESRDQIFEDEWDIVNDEELEVVANVLRALGFPEEEVEDVCQTVSEDWAKYE